MAKSVEQMLSESDRLHDLAVKFRKQKDVDSANALDTKVKNLRKRAISKMGRRPKTTKGVNAASKVIKVT